MKLTIMHTGTATISENTPYGNDCSLPKAAGLLPPWGTHVEVPVSVYLIEAPKGTVLFDTGWGRAISPKGRKNYLSMLKALGNPLVFLSTKGTVSAGKTVEEQLASMGKAANDIDYIVISHLDCDHTGGLKDLSFFGDVLVSKEEKKFARQPDTALVRYNSAWWKGSSLKTFSWNGNEGPFKKSYDLFGDGTVILVALPGHTPGHMGVVLKGQDRKYIVLAGDSSYDIKAVKKNILPGILPAHREARKTDQWLRECLMDPLCKAIFANHDPAVKPETIEW